MRSWKQPPKDKSKLWVNTSIEHQILLLCPWSCHCCDVFSNFDNISWVRKATMTIQQVKRYAQEMRDNNAYIGRHRVLGGEPTAHPKLREITEILYGLIEDGHLGQLEIVSNGAHLEKLDGFRHLFHRIRISDEGDKQKTHTANLANTPATLGYRGKTCTAPGHCGISLNYYGYFPCSSGSGLARLMNDMKRWQRMSLPKQKPLLEWPDLNDLCQNCYHSLRSEDKVKAGTNLYELNVPHPEMWKHLGGWLNGRPVPKEWQVYGEMEAV